MSQFCPLQYQNFPNFSSYFATLPQILPPNLRPGPSSPPRPIDIEVPLGISNIILKRLIWRFQIYNLFRDIFTFCEGKSNNEFREILKCFCKTAKLEFSRNKLYIWNLQITRFKMICDMFVF